MKQCKSSLAFGGWAPVSCILDRKHPGPHEGSQHHRAGGRFCYMVTWWKATDPADWKVAKEETR